MELFDTHFVEFGGVLAQLPRLFSEHSLKNENKHQIVNVQTKWN